MTVRTRLQPLIQRARSGVALAGLSGLVAFGLALAFLSFDGFGLVRPSAPVADRAYLPEEVPTVTSTPAVPVAGSSLAAGVLTGHMAVGVRLKSDSVPLTDLHVGAMLDVLATLADGPDAPGLVGPVVSGAKVLAVSPSTDHADVLLDAPADAAMLLAHVVRRGLPLMYTVRQAPDEPRQFPVMTLDETRARLALAPRLPPTLPPAVQAVPPTAAAQVQPTLPEAPGVSEVHFVAYTGVDLVIIEDRFDVSEAALLAANPGLAASEPLAPGTELVVPDLYGFSYRVQSGDTLESLSQRYHAPSAQISLVNALPLGEPLPVGDRLLIPAARPAWATAARGQ